MSICFTHLLLIFYSNFACLRGNTVVAPRFLRCTSDHHQPQRLPTDNGLLTRQRNIVAGHKSDNLNQRSILFRGFFVPTLLQ